MSRNGMSPARVWASYPHIILTLVVAFLILMIQRADWIFFAFLALVALGVLASKLIRHTVDFIAKCTTPVLLGVLVVFIYFEIYQTKEILGFNIKNTFGLDATEILKLAQFDPDYQEPFYTAISTLYAIILALALVKGMEDVDDLRQSIAEETHRVRSIWNYLKYFEDNELTRDSLAARDRFRELLIDYLKNIPSATKPGNPAQNRKVLNDCRGAVLEIEPYDRDDFIAQKEIMRSLETIGIMRAKRLGANSGKLSSYLMVALWVMSLALLLPFMAEPLCVDPGTVKKQLDTPHIQEIISAQGMCSDGERVLSPQRFSQYYMIFIIVSFFSFLMLMLHDLSSPDKGFWRVDHGAFDELRGELEEDLITLPKAPPDLTSPMT